MVGREPFDFSGLNRPQVDLLISEYHCDAFGVAAARIEILPSHAERLRVPDR
jgi:hypothetical protein